MRFGFVGLVLRRGGGIPIPAGTPGPGVFRVAIFLFLVRLEHFGKSSGREIFLRSGIFFLGFVFGFFRGRRFLIGFRLGGRFRKFGSFPGGCFGNIRLRFGRFLRRSRDRRGCGRDFRRERSGRLGPVVGLGIDRSGHADGLAGVDGSRRDRRFLDRFRRSGFRLGSLLGLGTLGVVVHLKAEARFLRLVVHGRGIVRFKGADPLFVARRYAHQSPCDQVLHGIKRVHLLIVDRFDVDGRQSVFLADHPHQLQRPAAFARLRRADEIAERRAFKPFGRSDVLAPVDRSLQRGGIEREIEDQTARDDVDAGDRLAVVGEAVHRPADARFGPFVCQKRVFEDPVNALDACGGLDELCLERLAVDLDDVASPLDVKADDALVSGKVRRVVLAVEDGVVPGSGFGVSVGVVGFLDESRLLRLILRLVRGFLLGRRRDVSDAQFITDVSDLLDAVFGVDLADGLGDGRLQRSGHARPCRSVRFRGSSGIDGSLCKGRNDLRLGYRFFFGSRLGRLVRFLVDLRGLVRHGDPRVVQILLHRRADGRGGGAGGGTLADFTARDKEVSLLPADQHGDRQSERTDRAEDREEEQNSLGGSQDPGGSEQEKAGKPVVLRRFFLPAFRGADFARKQNKAEDLCREKASHRGDQDHDVDRGRCLQIGFLRSCPFRKTGN